MTESGAWTRQLCRLAPHGVLIAVVLLLGGATVGCSGRSDAELRFIDALRNRYPNMSVARASDDTLVTIGLATCGGAEPPEMAPLVRAGVDPEVVAGLAADTICPGR